MITDVKHKLSKSLILFKNLIHKKIFSCKLPENKKIDKLDKHCFHTSQTQCHVGL